MNDNAQPAAATESASRRIALTVAAAFFMETLDATVIVTALPAARPSASARWTRAWA
jgi:hypothetical protein